MKAGSLKVTLHHVAARARVSIATASKALNGLAVSADSLRRVRRAAQELGYIRNEGARSLRSERTLTLGLLFYKLTSTAGLELLDGLAAGVEDSGFSLLVSTARGDSGRYDLLLGRFLERRVDALFCVNPRGPGAPLRSYAAAHIPVLTIQTREGAFRQQPLVKPTIAGSACETAALLQQLGHRHAIVLGRKPHPRPLAVFAANLKAHGIRVVDVEFAPLVPVRDALAALTRGGPRPTVAIGMHREASALAATCRAAGLRVPEELSVVAISEWSDRHSSEQLLSAIAIDPRILGRAAGTAMCAWLGGAEPEPQTRVEVGVWHKGRTTGAAPVV